MFEAIVVLRQQLSPDQHLEVVHAGHVWRASFQWSQPTSNSEVLDIQSQLDKPLPEDYKAFLIQIANGAVLFYDIQYGQWGFKLYSTSELLEKQNIWQKSFPRTWRPNFIAFAELFGEANVMVFNLDMPTKDLTGCAAMEGNAYDPVDYWPIASRSFQEWLDHLITAQGDKYWEWK